MTTWTTHDDEHGSTTDYWDAYPVTIDPDEVPFLLTDYELDQLSSEVDDIDTSEVDLPDWFAPINATPPF
jgi:hypothetical protein